ncbi:MAG: SHOCT domain-containing protein [Methanobrevibacter sp.]|jgi:hypothetical protein|nr:SHOCT domain-containing protein [Methanobrevibacter sp.]
MFKMSDELIYKLEKLDVLDASPGLLGGRRHDQTMSEWRRCHVNVYSDRIHVEKYGFWTGSNKGEQTVFFEDISNIDEDRGFLSSHLTVGFRGSDALILRSSTSKMDEYKKCIVHVYENFKKNRKNENNTSFGSKENNHADDIKRFHDLMVEGIISEDEFEAKKKKLLDL